jgi:hypothetical protein
VEGELDRPVRVRHRTGRVAALILRVVGYARDGEDDPERRHGERVRRLVRVDRLRRLAVDEDAVADRSLRPAVVRIPQPLAPSKLKIVTWMVAWAGRSHTVSRFHCPLEFFTR